MLPETMCVFSPDGVLQETHRRSNPQGMTPTKMFEAQLKDWPAGTRVGRYVSQEMLPASKIGIAVRNATLSDDGLSFRIHALAAIIGRLARGAISNAEGGIIELTKEIEAISITMAMVGEHRSESLNDHYGLIVTERSRLAAIVRRELEPDIHVDENLARIAGECFAVTLDPSTVSG